MKKEKVITEAEAQRLADAEAVRNGFAGASFVVRDSNLRVFAPYVGEDDDPPIMGLPLWVMVLDDGTVGTESSLRWCKYPRSK